MASTSQGFFIIALGIGLNLGFAGIKPEQVSAQSTQVNFITRYASARTNNQGFFSVNHNVAGGRIWSISVAVLNVNGNWHTLDYSNTLNNRFWWNNTSVQGQINGLNFRNRPVKILLFTY
jgi:hypothetical protein